jgi:hypothetical protein
VGAFIHRLLIVALQIVEPSCAAPLVALSRTLLTRYPVTQQLLEGDDDRTTTGGSFKPLPIQHEDLPELSNPFSAAAWELTLLCHHWHPDVRDQAKKSCKLLPTTSTDNPLLLSKTLSKHHLFYPGWKLPTEHPLSLQVKKQANVKERNRKAIYVNFNTEYKYPPMKLMHYFDQNVMAGDNDDEDGRGEGEDDEKCLDESLFPNCDLNTFFSDKGRQEKVRQALKDTFNENAKFILEKKMRIVEKKLALIREVKANFEVEQEAERKMKAAAAAAARAVAIASEGGGVKKQKKDIGDKDNKKKAKKIKK